MQAVLRALIVRQIEHLDADAVGCDHGADLLDGGLIGAVRTPDGQRGVVEPEHVAAISGRIPGEPTHEWHAEFHELTGQQWRLPRAHGLGTLELDHARGHDEGGVVGEDRVGHVVDRVEHLHLRAERSEQRDEVCVLPGEEIEIERLRPVGCDVVAPR